MIIMCDFFKNLFGKKADVPNANGRIYPRAILEREVEKYTQKILERRAYGEEKSNIMPEEIYNNKEIEVPKMEEEIKDNSVKLMTVILDNGHGEETPGKRSPVWEDGSQLFEYEFNRAIVERIVKQLDKLKIPYKVLVPEITDITLTERCKRANKICDDTEGNCFLISVHANAGGGTGWECHIYSEKTKSKDYADILTDEASSELVPDWKIRQPMPNQKYWVSNYQILRGTKCPSILTENFFMDTEKDCRYIMSDEGRDKVADIHVNAIKKIVG
jgi:N-acetylmuramoyl-L-alanine amidase